LIGVCTVARPARSPTMPRDITAAPSMAAEARRLAPEMAWPVVASAYQHLVQRLIAAQRAAV
jgi:hypothetical protein